MCYDVARLIPIFLSRRKSYVQSIEQKTGGALRSEEVFRVKLTLLKPAVAQKTIPSPRARKLGKSLLELTNYRILRTIRRTLNPFLKN